MKTGRLCLAFVVLAGACSMPKSTRDEAGVPGAREVRSLDGVWEIIFDAGNEGAGAWHEEQAFTSHPARREIVVPNCWEEVEQDYEGVAFYGRSFAVPESWRGKAVRLRFDAVNYIAEVWVNDRVAGRHEGGYGPFELRVDELLDYGAENFVSLRVLGPVVAEDKHVDGLGRNDAPHWRGAITGGIWQSVRLVATGMVFVDDVFVAPRLEDDMVKVRVALENSGAAAREAALELSVRSDDSGKAVTAESVKLEVPAGRSEHEWTLKVPSPRYWSPADPHLYVAVIEIAGEDRESVRFGMRELTIRGGRFELNGKPIYIKAAFFEGLYPTKLARPDSIEMARREIRLALECGFNMIRPWRKPPPPEWLDLCDEMGVMVVGGFPIECMKRWPTVTPELPRRIENEVRSAVMRDRSRACIVQWEIFNEIHREELAALKDPMSKLARRLDPTRLVLDESGGFAGGSSMYLPGSPEPEPFNDVHSYPGAPLNDDAYDRFLAMSKTPKELARLGLEPSRTRSRTTPGRLTLVSEIGYGSLPDLVENNERFARDDNPLTPPYRYHRDMARWMRDALAESGLDAVYPDLREFCLDQQKIHSQGNKRMIEAIRSNSSTGGYAVHALTGGDWVMGAGLLDLFRNPKAPYHGTKEANRPRYLALRVRPRNIYASRGARITTTGINDREDVAGKLSVEVITADGGGVLRFEEDASLAAGISRLSERRLDASKLAGAYTVRARLEDPDGKAIAENAVAIDVFGAEELSTPKAKIALLDSGDVLRPFLKRAGVRFAEFGADTPRSLPVFVAKAKITGPESREQFRALHRFVQGGGTAVYLDTIQRSSGNFWVSSMPAEEVLPVKARLENAFGLWVGVSHVVTDHPVFEGLPSKCMMGQLYENVWSPHTLRGLEGELIVGSVSHGWHQDEEDRQNYLGPSPAWWGMDLGVVPSGEGRYVLSGLRIVENLGRDPVADRLLFNMIRWTTKR